VSCYERFRVLSCIALIAWLIPSPAHAERCDARCAAYVQAEVKLWKRRTTDDAREAVAGLVRRAHTAQRLRDRPRKPLRRLMDRGQRAWSQLRRLPVRSPYVGRGRVETQPSRSGWGQTGFRAVVGTGFSVRGTVRGTGRPTVGEPLR
jgi:hypothetical protein